MAPAPFVSFSNVYTESASPKNLEDDMKNKIAEALHSDTFRSLAIALLMVSVAILLSACAGGPVHPGGGGE
ncbi:MAG: hypothetical protein IPG33_13470 [Betaproteobacteria bacterium]|jgi:hypothetical protein|nr:hypothetical protein [Betaproteobacteria bacterium]